MINISSSEHRKFFNARPKKHLIFILNLNADDLVTAHTSSHSPQVCFIFLVGSRRRKAGRPMPRSACVCRALLPVSFL